MASPITKDAEAFHRSLSTGSKNGRLSGSVNLSDVAERVFRIIHRQEAIFNTAKEALAGLGGSSTSAGGKASASSPPPAAVAHSNAQGGDTPVGNWAKSPAAQPPPKSVAVAGKGSKPVHHDPVPTQPSIAPKTKSPEPASTAGPAGKLTPTRMGYIRVKPSPAKRKSSVGVTAPVVAQLEPADGESTNDSQPIAAGAQPQSASPQPVTSPPLGKKRRSSASPPQDPAVVDESNDRDQTIADVLKKLQRLNTGQVYTMKSPKSPKIVSARWKTGSARGSARKLGHMTPKLLGGVANRLKRRLPEGYSRKDSDQSGWDKQARLLELERLQSDNRLKAVEHAQHRTSQENRLSSASAPGPHRLKLNLEKVHTLPAEDDYEDMDGEGPWEPDTVDHAPPVAQTKFFAQYPSHSLAVNQRQVGQPSLKGSTGFVRVPTSVHNPVVVANAANAGKAQPMAAAAASKRPVWGRAAVVPHTTYAAPPIATGPGAGRLPVRKATASAAVPVRKATAPKPVWSSSTAMRH
jgi:hypothetical protein